MTEGSDAPEFTIVRLVDAPRAVVWRLWTEPAEMARWFHPDGMHTPAESVSTDVRVGGRYRYTMVDDASGSEVPTGGEYLEVVEPERLVFTWGDVDAATGTAPVATVVLRDLGGRTELTFRLRGAAGRPGDGWLHDGWTQALANLAAAAGTTDAPSGARTQDRETAP